MCKFRSWVVDDTIESWSNSSSSVISFSSRRKGSLSYTKSSKHKNDDGVNALKSVSQNSNSSANFGGTSVRKKRSTKEVDPTNVYVSEGKDAKTNPNQTDSRNDS